MAQIEKADILKKKDTGLISVNMWSVHMLKYSFLNNSKNTSHRSCKYQKQSLERHNWMCIEKKTVCTEIVYYFTSDIIDH
jgi:hypothetical protein